MAKEFNIYFNKVAENLLIENQFDLEEAALEEEEEEDEDFLSRGGDKYLFGFLEKFQLTLSDVEKNIMKLKNKRSVGHDGISAYIVKQLPKLFARILLPLFNESLRQGKFPEIFKTAIIVPV